MSDSTANGAVFWSRRLNGRGNSGDTALAIGVTADGEKVVVTGQSVGLSTNTDYATVVYHAVTSGLERIRVYNRPASGGDEPLALAMGPASGAYVTGQSDGGETDQDFPTIGY